MFFCEKPFVFRGFSVYGQTLSKCHSGLTQAQLAETLEISQQLIAAYEAGSRKVPASMLPILARLFAVSLEQLIGMEATPAKRGPASILQRQIEQIGLMPRSKQKFITEMLEALIKQQQAFYYSVHILMNSWLLEDFVNQIKKSIKSSSDQGSISRSSQ